MSRNPSDCDNVVTQGIVSGLKRADKDASVIDRCVQGYNVCTCRCKGLCPA